MEEDLCEVVPMGSYVFIGADLIEKFDEIEVGTSFFEINGFTLLRKKFRNLDDKYSFF